jgi:hypothetical protein
MLHTYNVEHFVRDEGNHGLKRWSDGVTKQ